MVRIRDAGSLDQANLRTLKIRRVSQEQVIFKVINNFKIFKNSEFFQTSKKFKIIMIVPISIIHFKDNKTNGMI